MGWVEPHGNGWRGVYRDRTGKRQRSKVFMYKPAAQLWAKDQTEKVSAGVDRDPRRGRMKLRDFSAEWVDARSVEATTAASDAGRMKLIVKEFGDKPLEHIDALAIQAWAKKLRREGKAAATVIKYVHLLSAMLSAAVLAQRIPDNPCRYVKLDPAPPGRETYLTREQVEQLMDAMTTDVDRLAVHLLAYTGLRWGEAVALHRNRVDFLRRRLDVVEVVAETKGERWLKEYPKGRDRRWLPLPQHLVDALAIAYKASVVKCGLELRDSVGNVKPHRCSGLVLVSQVRPDDGKPRRDRSRPVVLSRHTWPRDRFKPALEAVDLPDGTRVHDLRHTYASWCAMAGIPIRELQRRLGHKSIVMTERYSHFYEDGEPNLSGLDRPGRMRDAR